MQNDDIKSALELYATDFTQLALDGKLDPVIGRDDEIRRVIQVLSRRTKNNPVLIGAPGVGKTSVVEGLAQRIVKDDVPFSLKNKRLLLLDLSSLVAGAKFKGEFEERLKAVLKEILESSGNIITFIDELHTLVGTGGGAGGVDAGNMLKPLLARGELHMIGATTIDEYKQYIEKDPALERRFQAILVKEPSVSDTIGILRGLKEKYENFHNITISDSALSAAAALSDRYITNRNLPDKAIDLIDEASSKLKMQLESVPFLLDSINREIDKLKMEEFQLMKEKDAISTTRLAKIAEQLNEHQMAYQQAELQWKEEKALLNGITSLQIKMEEAKNQANLSQRNGDLESASRILYVDLPKYEAELAEQRLTLNAKPRMLSSTVTEVEIQEIISAWTGIPLNKISESEGNKYLTLASRLKSVLIDQDYAVDVISRALVRARSGIITSVKPMGVFLLLGPTGVGKTELAKQLAIDLFDSEKALLRFDMSEYSEKHNVARLIGAPPGYIGYEEGGQLTELVKRNPYSIILLDEIEKAHPGVYDILLQIFDDGRLTDGSGNLVNFSNTIILMTSNIGSDHISIADGNNSVVNDELILREYFRPEFLNRIDEIVRFKPLTSETILKIADNQLKNLIDKLGEQNINLVVEPSALDWISTRGYDIAYGARPLRRILEREVISPISELVLSNKLKTENKIIISATSTFDDKLTIKY